MCYTSYRTRRVHEQRERVLSAVHRRDIIEYSSLPTFRWVVLRSSSSKYTKEKAIINPQNVNEKCFKWAFFAKFVTGEHKYRVAENYITHEEKFNFNELAFPTPLNNVNIFEKNNPGVLVNVYGLKKPFNHRENCHFILFIRSKSRKKRNPNISILLSYLITENDKSHFGFINNFSRLVRYTNN